VQLGKRQALLDATHAIFAFPVRLKGFAPETSTKPKHLKLLAAMFVKTEQDVKLVPEVRSCEAQFVLEFIECGTTHIAQRHMFELAPLIFDRLSSGA
jgi:hypothetical protein